MTLSGIGELPLFKRRSNTAEELDALLDLLAHPTLIADGRSGRVLFANALAAQLTAYTRKEFLELDVNTLLPEFPLEELEKTNSKNNRAQALVKRNSQTVPAELKLSQLGGPEHWVAISLQTGTQADQHQVNLDEQRWEALHLLTLAAQQSELASCYRQILQAGALITGARHLLLYVQNLNGELDLESV